MNFARQMAVAYATDLMKRLENYYIDNEMGHVGNEEPMTDTKHLIWMCQQVVDYGGGPDHPFSDTKAHRWIGYIQGVMTVRGITTVEFERKNYVEIKKGLGGDNERMKFPWTIFNR